MLDDLVKALLAGDNEKAENIAKNIEYMSFKDISFAMILATSLKNSSVTNILSEKAQLQNIENSRFAEELSNHKTLVSMQVKLNNLNALSDFIIIKFVTDRQVDLKPNEYTLLDCYLLNSMTLNHARNGKQLIKERLTSSETANDILIKNIENYISMHPEHTSYPTWVSAIIGQYDWDYE